MREAFLLIVLASTACSSGASVGDANKVDSGVSTTDAGASAAAGDDADAIPTTCGSFADAGSPGATCVLEAKGSVEDLSGAPLDNLTMTFCGAQCYGTQSNKTGAFAIGIGSFI